LLYGEGSQQQPSVLPPAPSGELPPIIPGFIEGCHEYSDCVPYYLCDEAGFIITDGNGILNPRQKPLPSDLPEVINLLTNDFVDIPMSSTYHRNYEL
jgi:hypothetical protein